MKHIHTKIRKMHPEEYGLLREFLYQAIYLPEGVELPPRSVVDLPELQENGYLRASRSIQKESPALRLYERAGFHIVAEKGTEYLMLWDGTQRGQQENAELYLDDLRKELLK